MLVPILICDFKEYMLCPYINVSYLIAKGEIVTEARINERIP